MNATLILISKREEYSQFLEGVSASSAAPARVYRESATAAAEAVTTQSPILFVDSFGDGSLAEFEVAFGPLLGEGPGKIPSSNVHVIGSDNLSGGEAFKDILGSFCHYLLWKSGDLMESGRHYGRILSGLHQHHKIAFEPMASKTLRHSSEKAEALASLEGFLRNDTSFVGRSVSLMVTAVDELIMNAIYDAPVDPKGEQVLKNVQRDFPIELPEDRAVDLHLSFDGEYAAFTVTDRFGSIHKEKLLNHLLTQQAKESLTVDGSGAGAGIGLAATFMLGGSLVFLYDPGVSTSVTVLFRQTKNFKEFKEQFRFFSMHRRPTQ